MPFVTTNAAELWLITPGFDDLRLNGPNTDSTGATYIIDALDDEATWAAPVPVDVAVQRWMADGAVATTQGHDNREISFKVRVEATSATLLAAGEAALALRSAQAGLLKWIPPSGSGSAPASVFEVWTWHLEHDFDGTDERHLQRSYVVRVTAKPWARSLDLTEIAAVPTSAVPTLTSIDTCSSLTGWTGTPNTPTLVGGTSIRETQVISATGNAVTYLLVLTRTVSVTGLGATPYLVIDAAAIGGNTNQIAVRVNGTTFLSMVAQVGSAIYFSLGGLTSFTSLSVMVGGTARKGVTVTLTVSDISATATIGGIGTALQIPRSLDIGGSVTTSGSLQIASPSATTLGNVLVYTAPQQVNGFTPPLRRFRSGSSTTVQASDGAAVSGFHDTLVTAGTPNGSTAYSIPLPAVTPSSYVVVARYSLSTSATPTFTFSAGGSPQFVSPVPTIIAGYQWGILGVLNLPTIDSPIEASTRAEAISITAAHTGTVLLDEVYLLDVIRGDFSLIQVGAGGTRLWLDASDVDIARNRLAVYIGTASDRSDAARPFSLAIKAVGDHDLDPTGTAVLVVADGVANVVVTASFYRRWHTSAGT